MQMHAPHLDVDVDAKRYEDRPHDNAEGRIGGRREAHRGERGTANHDRKQCLGKSESKRHDPGRIAKRVPRSNGPGDEIPNKNGRQLAAGRVVVRNWDSAGRYWMPSRRPGRTWILTLAAPIDLSRRFR